MAISDQQYLDWLSRDGEPRCVLFEADVMSGGAVVTRYGSNYSYETKPTDTPANQAYDEILVSVPRFKGRIDEALGGNTRVSYGEAEVDNSSGIRDAWLLDAWDGRPVRLYLGSPAWAKSDFRLILNGVADDIVAKSANSLTIKLNDRQQLLNGPIQTKLIAAGTANAQKPVPLCYGEYYNFEPSLVDAATRKYQVHDGQVEAITTVYDAGKSIAFTPDLTTGTFTLAANPAGRVTVDGKGCKLGGAYVSKVADIVQRIVTTRSSLTVADLDAASFSALNTLCPQTVGICIGERRNTLDVLDELLKSIGGFYGFSRAGRLKVARFDAPAGSPVLDLTADDIELNGLDLRARILPVATVRLGYKRNWTQQTDGLDTTLTPARRAELGDNYQVASASNAGIGATFLTPLSPDVIGTVLVSQADAQAEANRRAARDGQLRFRFVVRCFTAPGLVELGQVIRLTHWRYGFSAGQLVTVVDIDESPTSNSLTLELWR